MPLPFKSPVTLVVRVIAGVVVAVATVPAKPFAETTDTLVTVPETLLVTVIVPAPLVTVMPVPAVKVFSE